MIDECHPPSDYDYDLSALAPAEGDSVESAPSAVRSVQPRQLARRRHHVGRKFGISHSRPPGIAAGRTASRLRCSASPSPAGPQSSLTDELILRLRLDQQYKLRVAVISIDPSAH